MQAEEYGQKIQDAAMKAKDYASEKFAVAGEKFKELQDKDPKELVEEAKEFARKKPRSDDFGFGCGRFGSRIAFA